MEWTAQQSDALFSVKSWLNTRRAPQVFRLFGFAGAGKTSLAREITQMVRGRTLFMAYTGKAALVLRNKGCLGAGTIHSFIYKPDEDLNGRPIFTLNPESLVRGAKLVIIDECSCVSEELAKDLLSFGVRILVLGDPAQLPPIKGAGYFTETEPDVMLTEIHRQALDNPIVKMSMDVREGRGIELGSHGDSKVISRRDLRPGEIMAADQVICGLNNTRRGLNVRFRQKLGYFDSCPDFPHEGDRLVCLKNDRLRQLYNGGLWFASQAQLSDRFVSMDVMTADDGGPDKPVSVVVPVEYFCGTEENLPYWTRRNYDAFDFGYALTCHKSMGSQWDHIVVFDESRVFRENASRWLYTAITRAAQKITIVV